jgi:hypothetical protein
VLLLLLLLLLLVLPLLLCLTSENVPVSLVSSVDLPTEGKPAHDAAAAAAAADTHRHVQPLSLHHLLTLINRKSACSEH